MSRCVACDKRMSKDDFYVDDDMCRRCLATIVEDLKLSQDKLEEIDKVKKDETS